MNIPKIEFISLMKYPVKSVLMRLYKRKQHTKFCIHSNNISCRVDLDDVIAMGYNALYQITAIFGQTNKKKFGFVCWLAGTLAMSRSNG